MSQICRDRFNRTYYCNRSGLSYGARIGIGLGVAAGVLLLCGLMGYWRRRQIRHQFSKHTPPTLPFVNNNNGNNPYASNPPPPTQQTGSYYGQNPSQTNWNNNQYGQNPPPPSTTYQPSMTGQYGAGATNTATSDHEHGYEWEQAREAERLEREQGSGAAAPPGYDVAASQNKPGNANYAPPTGPPPAK